MGKKTSQQLLKTSKNEKKQPHNLIKVLRPKVYITDSSSFKSLVQEITGNGSSSNILSSPTPSISSPTAQNDIIIDVEGYPEPEISKDVSFDTSIDSIEFSNNHASITQEEEPSQWHYGSYCIDNDITSNCELINQEAGVSGCEDFESLLFDIDQYTLCSNYAHMFDHDQLGGFESDLSGLLC